MYNFTNLNKNVILDEKPKPPSEPAAPISKAINSVLEEDTPWRRSGSLKSRAQQEIPKKNRKKINLFLNTN